MPDSAGKSEKILHVLIRKLKRAGVMSYLNAVSAEEVGLSDNEVGWLDIFSQSWNSKIGKTKNNKYYVKKT